MQMQKDQAHNLTQEHVNTYSIQLYTHSIPSLTNTHTHTQALAHTTPLHRNTFLKTPLHTAPSLAMSHTNTHYDNYTLRYTQCDTHTHTLPARCGCHCDLIAHLMHFMSVHTKDRLRVCVEGRCLQVSMLFNLPIKFPP